MLEDASGLGFTSSELLVMGKGAGEPVGKGWLNSGGPEKDEGPTSGNGLYGG